MATLVPRKFKIDHDVNEYTYFVTFLRCLSAPEGKWAIQLDRMYMTTSFGFDYEGDDTAVFDTPEEALEFWKKRYVGGT